jgi:thymidine kinase
MKNSEKNMHTANQNKKGTLEVVCGSMFSGKTEELIRRLHRAQFARLSIIAFKHSLDTRTTIEYVVSHNGVKIKALPMDNPLDILKQVDTSHDVVGIDEIQFFSLDVVNVVCQLIDMGKRVIVAGLDLDFKGMPFGCMPLIMSIADEVTKLKAICIDCGKDAHFTQRLVNGKPARFDDPIILVGAQESYQARCRSCHAIDKQPVF